MQILRVQNFCTSASHNCNFVFNQAKGRKSAVFLFPKKMISTTNCFGNAWATDSALPAFAMPGHHALAQAAHSSHLLRPPLLSALQYRSRIAMRTWRRTLPKRMTIPHALLRRGCSWKPHCLNKFDTAWSCLLFCFFVALLSSSSYVMNASICLEHQTHTSAYSLSTRCARTAPSAQMFFNYFHDSTVPGAGLPRQIPIQHDFVERPTNIHPAPQCARGAARCPNE